MFYGPVLLAFLIFANTVCGEAQVEPVRPEPGESAPFAGPTAAADGVTINPSLFANVKDRTRGLAWEEREPYFRILQLARAVDFSKQREAARAFLHQRREANPKFRRRPEAEFPVFVDLFKHPDAYRGQPVTLRGHVRRLIEMASDKEPYPDGIPTLYEAWLYTDDSQGNPAVVVFTEKPKGMPEGGDLAEQVSVTGYFYKIYAYDAQDATRIAPMLLARGIIWHPPPRPGWVSPPPWVYAAVGATVLVLVVLAWRFTRRERLRLAILQSGPAPDLKPFHLDDTSGSFLGSFHPDAPEGESPSIENNPP